MKKIFTLLCSFVFSMTLVHAQLPSATVTTTQATNCTAPCDGTASVGSSSVAGLTFVWNTTPVQTTSTATGLCPGVYTCTVSLAPFGSTSGTGTVTCATAVTEISAEENVSLFPNPAHSELNLQLDQTLDGLVILNIRNILGTVVYQGSFEGSTSTKIDIAGLPVGVYDVELVNENRILRNKFVKQ